MWKVFKQWDEREDPLVITCGASDQKPPSARWDFLAVVANREISVEMLNEKVCRVLSYSSAHK